MNQHWTTNLLCFETILKINVRVESKPNISNIVRDLVLWFIT